MIKTNSSTSSPCGTTTTSECVIWQGGDIACLGIKNGDTLSVSIAALATEICNLIEELDLDDLDLKCIFSICVDCPVPRKTLKTVLGLIINKICSLEEIINALQLAGTTDVDPVITLASCFQYTDADGDLIVELPHSSYTKRIALKVCQLLLDVSSMQDDISDLQVQVNDLQTQINNLDLTIPDVSSDCLFVGTKSIEDAWELMDMAFCQLRDALGMPTDLNNAISQQCDSMNAEFGASPGWTVSPENLAQSVANLWIAFCAYRTTVASCCAADCADVLLGFSTSFNEDNTEITLLFTSGAGTNIPAGFTDGGSSGTITDIDGNVESFNLTIENNAEIVIPISSLNLTGDLEISINAIMTTGTLTCQKCLLKTIKKPSCNYCEICATGDAGASIVVVYKTESSTSATVFDTTTTTSTTTTTTAAP